MTAADAQHQTIMQLTRENRSLKQQLKDAKLKYNSLFSRFTDIQNELNSIKQTLICNQPSLQKIQEQYPILYDFIETCFENIDKPQEDMIKFRIF